MNPLVGSEKGRVILSSRSAPTDPKAMPPAVFITDSAQCQYLSFDALTDAGRRLLAGALIIAFNPEARTVDVFYVDEDGQKSADVVTVPTGWAAFLALSHITSLLLMWPLVSPVGGFMKAPGDPAGAVLP